MIYKSISKQNYMKDCFCCCTLLVEIRFGPNFELYKRFLHPNAEYINNLYFDFVFLLRAVNKASHIIKNYDYDTGNIKDDSLTKELITKLYVFLMFFVFILYYSLFCVFIFFE